MHEHLTKNDQQSRFELHIDDELAGVIDYRDAGEVIEMYHTEVDPAHAGKGYGQRLVGFALADARDLGRHVAPTCPFIDEYISAHPEFEALRA